MIGKLGDFLRREVGEGEGRDFAEQLVAQSIQSLEMLEEQDEFLDVREGEPVIGSVKRMRDGVREIFRGEIFLQVENVVPHRLDLAVLRLGDAPHQEMHFATVVRKTGADLFADENARPPGDFEAAFNAVVIGEGDEIHPALAQLLVLPSGLRVAVGKTGAAEEPFRGAVAETGVQVEIGFHGIGKRN
ncbi:hypothetical protein CfE428DRAFT_3550 [Chthoniobacter flavus Ellin428]|uniref:Uncharacterized protein n=1 Tax=Chthoniobacter flavus Ellin428 TaxID=497964 RepID=B4D3R2_9BACT|nr:hypothetical protein [Chthoniobacter flavus]EDY18892.1 hypothetical protein CfE428DRAFT_3550 [Chthoniobacter flavus Ellin428]